MLNIIQSKLDVHGEPLKQSSVKQVMILNASHSLLRSFHSLGIDETTLCAHREPLVQGHDETSAHQNGDNRDSVNNIAILESTGAIHDFTESFPPTDRGIRRYHRATAVIGQDWPRWSTIAEGTADPAEGAWVR